MKYFLIFLFIVGNLLSQNEPYDLSLEELLTLKVSIGSRGNLKNIFQSPIPLAVITKEDLENNWAVVAEAIQTILRRENYPNPYEALKELTRGNNAITKKSMHAFIDSLKITSSLKKELKAITPHNYVGVTAVY